MRRPVVDPDVRSVRPPLALVSAAAPIVLVAVGAVLLLSNAEVPVLALDPDILGFGLVIVGLVWLLRRLTSIGQAPERRDELGK